MFRRFLLLVVLLVVPSSLAACGGSDTTDTGASELAHQHEVAEARRQGAQDARQATRIETLERELHAVTHRGLDAGVLFSSDYSSLRPGYRVVFSGVFPDDSDAEARASRAHELGYPDAYPRFVAP